MNGVIVSQIDMLGYPCGELTLTSSGLTVKAWCQENGVSPGSYYRWQRRLYDLSTVQTERAEFAEVPLGKRSTTVAVLHLPGGDVEVLPGADEETLRTICRVMRHAE